MREGRVVEDAVLLAAGRGTRMKGLTEETPKPMLPVAGRPLLEHIVVALRDAGIRRFVAVVGWHAERIEEHFGDGRALGVSIAYRRQHVRDGTAGALKLVADALERRPFLLGWGDILTAPSNYPRLLERWANGEADLVLALHWVEDPHRGAAVHVRDDGRVERIVEKPPPGTAGTHWMNAGIAIAGATMLDYVARVPLSPRGEYEIPDAIAAMIGDGRVVEGLALEGPWLDVGTPEDLARAEALLSSGRRD